MKKNYATYPDAPRTKPINFAQQLRLLKDTKSDMDDHVKEVFDRYMDNVRANTKPGQACDYSDYDDWNIDTNNIVFNGNCRYDGYWEYAISCDFFIDYDKAHAKEKEKKAKEKGRFREVYL